MEIYQLEQFKIVAELQHMTRAAEVLNITQPALSRTIRILEEEYGTTFFDRRGKSIVLNDKGEIFLKYVNMILTNLQQADHAIKEQIDREETTINLVVQSCGMVIADVIRKFKEEYPQVNVNIIQYDSWVLKSGQPDLMLTATLQHIDQENSLEVLRERMLLAVPADHPLAEHGEVSLSQFAHAPLVGVQPGSMIASFIKYYYQLAGYEPRFFMDHYTSTSIPDMIEMGMGVAFIPEITWQGAINERIRLLKIKDIPFARSIILSWPEGEQITRAARFFRNYLMDYLADLASQQEAESGE